MTEEERKDEHTEERRRQPVYTISIAARLTHIPIHTIRWLEAKDIVEPARTSGNQRLYSDADIDLLRELALLLQRGVNIAGMRTIIQIKRTYHIRMIQESDFIIDEEEEY